MTKRIFRAICIAALSVFLVTFVLIGGVLYGHFSSVQQNQLKVQVNMAAQGVERAGEEYLEGLDIGNYRITWIDSDGEVLYDSQSAAEDMDNHMEREEIQEAMVTGYGESNRYSSTLMERYMYAARKLSDDTIVRLSVAHSSVLLLLIGMLPSLLAVVIVAAILSFLLAGRLSGRIVKPLNELNLEQPLENEGYDELSPLLRRIYSQQKQLKLQQEDLQHKKNELTVILENMKEGMILLDKKGNIISINKAAKKLLEAENSCLGANILTVSRNMELLQAVEGAAEGETVSFCCELQGKMIQIGTAPVFLEQEITGIAVVFFDVTEKEKAEQRRREFTANVSHELKTPLHAISGYSELIQCGMVKDGDVKAFAGQIYKETGRLIRLVEDIMNLSRLDEGGDNMQKTPLDLYEIAGKATEMLQPAAKEKGVSLELLGSPTPISGIQELVHTIVYNLCDNGIKYNREGGRVQVTVEETDGQARLTVKDTGIGIPKEDLDRVFERFYRVDKSRTKTAGGTGLGLSIVKHAAQIHGAKIEVDSQEGTGTKITVKFPKALSEAEG